MHARFIAAVVDPATARSYLDQLTAALLSTEQLRMPFADQLVELEKRLEDRQALLGIDVSTDLEAALSEERSFASGSGTSADKGGEDPHTAHGVIADEPFRLAAAMAGYRTCHLTLASLDLTSESAKLAAIDAGYSSKNTLVFRLLNFGERSLARRHAMLGALLPCRSALGDYFAQVLCLDPTTGQRPKRLQTYRFTGPTGTDDTLLKALLQGKLLGKNWYHSVGGVYHLKQQRFGTTHSLVDPADYLCRPKCTSDFCAHMHLLFVGMGWPAVAANGSTFVTWGEFYNNHIEQCTRLSNLDEQYGFLEHAVELFEVFLRLVGELVQAFASLLRPTEGQQGALAPFDCAPARELQKKQTSLNEYCEHRDEWNWRGGTSTPMAVDPECLPRLSNKGKTSKPSAKAAEKRTRRETEKARSEVQKKQAKQRQASRVAAAEEGEESRSRGAPPGSLDDTACWLSSKTTAKPLLLKSGQVWDIKGVAAKYGTTINAKC